MKRLKKILINTGHTVKQALKQMDAMGEKTLFVVDDQERLLGTVTDGDIRRWILKGRSLTENVNCAMNSHPVSLKRDFVRETAKHLILKQALECLPVIDDNNKVISAIWWTDLFKKNQIK